MGDWSRSAPSDVWLRCGALITGDGEHPQRDMSIRIMNGVVADVRPWSSVDGAGAVEAVQLSDATVVPGFIDAHVHLVFANGEDHTSTRQVAENADTEALRELAAAHAVECLRGGVTSIRDCGDKDFVTLDVRDQIATGRLPGPRVVAAGPPITVTGGHLYWCGEAVGSAAEIPAVVERLTGRGVDLVKVIASGGNMTEESDPLHPQFAYAELLTMVALAHRAGRRVAAHAHSTEAIRRAVRARVDTVEHCTWRSADGKLDVDDEVVERIVEQGTHVVLTMAGIQRGLLPDHAGRREEQRAVAQANSYTGTLRGDFAWARDMRDAGARLVIASDAGVRLTPFDQFIDSIRCAMVALDLSASQAIGLATRTAAHALGIEKDVGSVEVGKMADLVVLDGIVDDRTARLGPIRQVWQAGRLVVENGTLLQGAGSVGRP